MTINKSGDFSCFFLFYLIKIQVFTILSCKKKKLETFYRVFTGIGKVSVTNPETDTDSQKNADNTDADPPSLEASI